MITDNRVLFHRVANTLNYLDIKTVVVSLRHPYDQLQGYKFEEIFPAAACRHPRIPAGKGITLGAGGRQTYLYHDPCHSPMKQQDPMKTVQALVAGRRAGHLTQVRFRKTEELRGEGPRCAS